MKSRFHPFNRLLLLLLGAFCVFVAATAVDIYLFSQRDETRKADAAIVLGAAVFRERPSNVFRERINHAVQLYQSGTVDKLVFTGGVGRRDSLSEAEVGRNYAVSRGVSASDIYLETTSTSTLENLTNAKMVAEVNGLESFLIVSTPFHMRRALAIAADLGLRAYSSPTRTTPWINEFTKSFAFSREVVAYLVYLLPIR